MGKSSNISSDLSRIRLPQLLQGQSSGRWYIFAFTGVKILERVAKWTISVIPLCPGRSRGERAEGESRNLKPALNADYRSFDSGFVLAQDDKTAEICHFATPASFKKLEQGTGLGLEQGTSVGLQIVTV